MPSRPSPRAASPRKPTRRSPSSSPDVPIAVPPIAGADAGPPAADEDLDLAAAHLAAPTDAPTDSSTDPTGDRSTGLTPVTPLPPGYRGLRVWQKALELAGGVFALSEGFPSSARDSMAVPMRRASAAIPAAIAEGNVRYTPREYTHYLSQALGTVAEVETLLFLSVRLGLATDARIAPLLGHCVELARMLRALTRSVQSPRAPIADRPTRRRAPSRD